MKSSLLTLSFSTASVSSSILAPACRRDRLLERFAYVVLVTHHKHYSYLPMISLTLYPCSEWKIYSRREAGVWQNTTGFHHYSTL